MSPFGGFTYTPILVDAPTPTGWPNCACMDVFHMNWCRKGVKFALFCGYLGPVNCAKLRGGLVVRVKRHTY